MESFDAGNVRSSDGSRHHWRGGDDSKRPRSVASVTFRYLVLGWLIVLVIGMWASWVFAAEQQPKIPEPWYPNLVLLELGYRT